MKNEFEIGQKVHWYNSNGVYIGIVTIVEIAKNFYRRDPEKLVYYVYPNDAHWCPVGSDSKLIPAINAFHTPSRELKYMERHRKQQEFDKMMEDLRNARTFIVN